MSEPAGGMTSDVANAIAALASIARTRFKPSSANVDRNVAYASTAAPSCRWVAVHATASRCGLGRVPRTGIVPVVYDSNASASGRGAVL